MSLYRQGGHIIKAFTLVEMIVVLMILAIMMMGIMTLSWSQIDKVRANYELSTIQQILYDLHGITQRSNIYQGQSYTTISLAFNDTRIQATNQSGTILFTQSLQYQNILTPFTLTYQPYVLGCSSDTDDIVAFQSIDNQKTCFKIETTSCKLKPISCGE